MGNQIKYCCGTYQVVDEIFDIDEMHACVELAQQIKSRNFSWKGIKEIIRNSAKNDINFFIVTPDKINKPLVDIISSIMQQITKIADVQDIYIIKMKDVHERDVLTDTKQPVFIFLYISPEEINSIQTIAKDIFICEQQPYIPDNCKIISSTKKTVIYYRN